MPRRKLLLALQPYLGTTISISSVLWEGDVKGDVKMYVSDPSLPSLHPTRNLRPVLLLSE